MKSPELAHELVATYTNTEDGIAADVFAYPDDYRVICRDTDADSVVYVRIYPRAMPQALAKAQAIARQFAFGVSQ